MSLGRRRYKIIRISICHVAKLNAYFKYPQTAMQSKLKTKSIQYFKELQIFLKTQYVLNIEFAFKYGMWEYLTHK